MMLILKRRECKGVDPHVVARMVEPSFGNDPADMLVIINSPDDPPVDTRPSASLSTPTDSRSVAEDIFQ